MGGGGAAPPLYHFWGDSGAACPDSSFPWPRRLSGQSPAVSRHSLHCMRTVAAASIACLTPLRSNGRLVRGLVYCVWPREGRRASELMQCGSVQEG